PVTHALSRAAGVLIGARTGWDAANGGVAINPATTRRAERIGILDWIPVFTGMATSLTRDLGEERLARGLAAEEPAHHVRFLVLHAGAEDGRAVARADLRIEEVAVIRREQ